MFEYPTTSRLVLVSLASATILSLSTATPSIPISEPYIFTVPATADYSKEATKPLVMDLGHVGSKQRARFQLIISPQDADEVIEFAFTSCGCVALEDLDALVGAPGPFLLRGYYDASWTDKQVVAEHQTITVRTNRRTVLIRAEVITWPTGSPDVHVLDRVQFADAADQIRVRHSLPAGSKILRLTPPPDSEALGVRIDFDPTSGQLDWEFNKALVGAWLRARQSEFPHTEILEMQVLHAAGDTLAPLAQLSVEIVHSGFARSTPAKIDFGVIRSGGQAVRRVMVEHGPLTLLRLEGPANMKIQPLLLDNAQSGQSAFQITLQAVSSPADASGASFMEEIVRVRLSDGTTLRIPAFCTFSPQNHDT